jgi:hypothetical protein
MSGPDTADKEPTSGHPRGPGMVAAAVPLLFLPRARRVVTTANGRVTAATAREMDKREKSHGGCALGLMVVVVKCMRKIKEIIMVVISSVFMAI